MRKMRRRATVSLSCSRPHATILQFRNSILHIRTSYAAQKGMDELDSQHNDDTLPRQDRI